MPVVAQKRNKRSIITALTLPNKFEETPYDTLITMTRYQDIYRKEGGKKRKGHVKLYKNNSQH